MWGIGHINKELSMVDEKKFDAEESLLNACVMEMSDEEKRIEKDLRSSIRNDFPNLTLDQLNTLFFIINERRKRLNKDIRADSFYSGKN